MRPQTNLFQNDVRMEKLEYVLPTRFTMDMNESREYLTKSGKVVQITKKEDTIQGTKGRNPKGLTTFFQICDEGKILQPFKPVGVRNYLKRN